MPTQAGIPTTRKRKGRWQNVIRGGDGYSLKAKFKRTKNRGMGLSDLVLN